MYFSFTVMLHTLFIIVCAFICIFYKKIHHLIGATAPSDSRNKDETQRRIVAT